MTDIDWGARREVFEHIESGEVYVKVRGGLMLVDDFLGEGGPVESTATFDIMGSRSLGVWRTIDIQRGVYMPRCV